MPSNNKARGVSLTEIKLLLSGAHRVEAVKNIFFSILLALLEVISLTTIIPVFYYLMGSVGNGRATPFFVELNTSWGTILTIIVLVFIIKNLYAFWLMQRQLAFANSLYTTFAQQLYEGFFRQSWKEHLQESSGEAFRKIKNTAFEFTNNVLLSYFSLATDGFLCLLITGVMLWIDYRIIFGFLVLTLPLIVFYYFFRKKVIARLDRSFRELTPITSVSLIQGLTSFAEAKIYGKESYFVNRFLALSETTTSLLARLKTIANLPAKIVETICVVCLAAIVITTKLFPETLQSLLVMTGLVILAMVRIIPSLNRMIVSLSQIQSYAYTVRELQEALGKDQPPKRNDIVSLNNSPNKIELQNLSFEYASGSNNFVLKEVNLTIDRGDFVILEGPSGSGKSTLIHILTGLINDYTGMILVNGEKLTPTNVRAWQSNLSFVPQSPSILQDTVLRNVAFGIEPGFEDSGRVELALEKAGLLTFIRSLPMGIHSTVGESGLTLSGGQRQRLALARAIYRDSNIMLLDEVTNQLDEKSKEEVLSNLHALSKLGRTIIMTSHDESAKHLATRILKVDKGRVSELALVSERGETRL